MEKKLTKMQLKILRTLYMDPGINHTKLCELLGTSPASLSNILSKILPLEPPLIKKETKGKYRYYSLTLDGRKEYKKHEEQEEVILKNNPLDTMSKELKEILITCIINNINSESEDELAKMIKSMKVEDIMAYFEMSEFLIFLLTFGMITKEQMSVTEATELLFYPNQTTDTRYIAMKVFQKLSTILDELKKQNLFDKKVESGFENIKNKEKV